MTDRSTDRKRLKLTALFVTLGLAAAACGGDATDATAAGQDADESAAAAQEADDSMEEDEAMEDEAMEDEAMEDEAMEDEAMEDGGTVTVTIENVADFAIADSGVFAVPVGADGPGPALPGQAYEFTTYAQPGQRLSFATMFVQTNDWFFAPDPAGIELFDADGAPISGDVTDQVFTFDSGTEVDQTVGDGADQAPRQTGPNSGDDDPDSTVRAVDRDASDYVGVLVTPGDGGRFDVRIENVSEMATVPSPIAPGVYAVHSPDASLFEIGAADAGTGLEPLAEDGDAGPLGEHLSTITGTATPIAPGVWATHGEAVALFELGAVDFGSGLESLAEDGDPGQLGRALGDVDGVVHAGVFNTPVGASDPGPALPGGSYSFELPVSGDRLSFATMFVQSNDWILSTPAEGLELSDLDGDISDRLVVVDVGTEVDQRPGFGADQAPRQAGPDVGADDENPLARLVEGRTAGRYITVTIERS